MLCRALIATIVLAYLMCVLILSGMQKEDLDISMLTKLQNHNVNINDMNNEELLQECIKLRYNNSNGEVINLTETQPEYVTDNRNNVLDGLKTKSILESLKSPIIAENDGLYNASGDYKNREMFVRKENNSLIKYVDEDKPNVDVLDKKDQAKLKNVLTFWNDIALNNSAKFTERIQKLTPKTAQENKRSITKNLHSTVNDAISGLLANFLSKGKIITNQPTTTKQLGDINNLYEKLYSLQINDFGKNVHYKELSTQSTTTPEIEIIKNSVMEREKLNRTNLPNIFELLNTHNIFNPLNPYIAIHDDRQTKESLMSRNPHVTSFRRSEKLETTTKDPISQDVIKEIAESVKEIILRDLRKEIFQTTTIRTTTTTIVSTTAALSTSNLESTKAAKENTKAESIMKKFLELFEEIKSLKQHNVIKTVNNVTNSELIPQKYDIKELKVYPIVTVPSRTLPLYNLNQAYGLKQAQKPNLHNIFNFAPQLHKFRSDSTMKIQESNKGLLPITVQTNNIEIPPIRIPLDKPQNLINQNIIVTTMIPYRIVANTKKNLQQSSLHVDRSKSFEAHTPKQLHPRAYEESNKYPIRTFYPNFKDDVIRLPVNNNERTKNKADYYEKINFGKYRLHSNNAGNERNHQVVPRFHEKLENIGRYRVLPEQKKYLDNLDCCDEKYGYSKAMVECCNRHIASRQQMSFSSIKKNSYDDTHFKNFLQSQQKVTDMLEKILSDKGNVQSVEIA